MELDLIEGALKDIESLKRKLEALRKNVGQEGRGAKLGAKGPNGRLSEAGVQRLRAMIDGGCRDSEIARALQITQPAVIHQRQKYLAEKNGADE